MQSDCFVRQHELVAVEPRRPLGYLHRGHLKADFPRLGQWILGPVLCERQEDAAMWFHAWGRSVAHNFLRRRGGTLPPRRSPLGAERWLLAWLCWWSPCRYLQAQWLQCPSPCVSSSSYVVDSFQHPLLGAGFVPRAIRPAGPNGLQAPL